MAIFKMKRSIENDYIEAMTILDWIEEVLDGNQVSELALSYPVVRKADDMMQYIEMLKERLQLQKGE